MQEAPLACLDLWLKAGSASEREGEEGLAHFLEHMIFKGSQNFKAGEFDLAIESLGGSSNAATGFDDVHFYVMVPSEAIYSALDHLTELVFQPALLEAEYKMEREVVLEEIAQSNDQPDEQVYKSLLKECWPTHAYGRPILGEGKSLQASTTLDMKNFHARQYTPRNCCLSIAGNVELSLKNFIHDSQLSGIVSTNSNQIEKNNTPFFNTGRKEIVIPRLESTRLIMAWPTVAANEQQTLMGIEIATSILAEGRRSRLVKKLREELQIVDSVELEITSLEQRGMILLEACCNEENVEEVEKEIHKTLYECTSRETEQKELIRAKHLVKNHLYRIKNLRRHRQKDCLTSILFFVCK